MGKKATKQNATKRNTPTQKQPVGDSPTKVEKPLGEKEAARMAALEKRQEDPAPKVEGEGLCMTFHRRDLVHLAEMLCTADEDLILSRVKQISGVIGPSSGASPSEKINEGLAILHELAPRDVLESLLCGQMIGTHNAAMEFIRRSLQGDRVDYSQKAASIATRFGNLFTRQVELLLKLRGQTGKQTVRVEHVTVEAGGQAIVGNVAPQASPLPGLPGGRGGEVKPQ